MTVAFKYTLFCTPHSSIIKTTHTEFGASNFIEHGGIIMGEVGSISSVNGESHVQSLGLEACLHLQKDSGRGCQGKGKLHSVHIQHLLLILSN